LCPWKRHLMLFPTLGLSSLRVVVAQTDERRANRTACVEVVWVTSGSNEDLCIDTLIVPAWFLSRKVGRENMSKNKIFHFKGNRKIPFYNRMVW